jgi:hypothetical protein
MYVVQRLESQDHRRVSSRLALQVRLLVGRLRSLLLLVRAPGGVAYTGHGVRPERGAGLRLLGEELRLRRQSLCLGERLLR